MITTYLPLAITYSSLNTPAVVLLVIYLSVDDNTKCKAVYTMSIPNVSKWDLILTDPYTKYIIYDTSSWYSLNL